MVRRGGLLSSDRLANEISAVTRVIMILRIRWDKNEYGGFTRGYERNEI